MSENLISLPFVRMRTPLSTELYCLGACSVSLTLFLCSSAHVFVCGVFNLDRTRTSVSQSNQNTMSSAAIVDVIERHMPSIDQQLTDYIVAVLTGDTYGSVQDVQEAVGEVLESCLNDVLNAKKNDADIETICHQLFSVVNVGNGATEENDEDEEKDGKLFRPVHLGSMAGEVTDTTENWKSIWTSGKIVDSKVDTRKLQKAEEKLKMKAEKREANPSQPNESPVIANVEATTSQMLNKKSVKQDQAGQNRSRDIKIENFDVSFGSHVLLQNAYINLSKL